MSHRYLVVLCAVIAVVALTPMLAGAQSAEAPRTPWGAPDLQGVWDFRSLTPLERPAELADQAFLTEEEAASLEQAAIDRNAELWNRAASRTVAGANVDRGEDGQPGFYNNFWLDGGTAPVETGRTSLIVDPPDGRIPPLTRAAAERRAAIERERRGVNRHAPTPGGFVEDLGPNALQLRCITGFNSGPPMTPGGYNQNVQLFQTPDQVVLLNEMNHNFRVIPLDGRSGSGIPQWTGESRGHWDGDTLVVETASFLRETSFCPGTDRCPPAADRALHARRCRHADVRGHGRQSHRVDQPLDLRDSHEVERAAVVRVRLSRGQLRSLQHPRRRPRRGGCRGSCGTGIEVGRGTRDRAYAFSTAG